MASVNRSKIGKSNVRKSKVHERRIAHLLTDWTGVEFRRRRVEGRDSTVVERESTADVIPVKGEIHFSLEAKSGKGFSLDALMGSCETSLFTSWWHQTTYDSMILSDVFKRQYYPMLFFKPHANFDWVAIAQDAFYKRLLRPHPSLNISSIGNSPWFPHIAFDNYNRIGEISLDVSHSKKHKDIRALRLPAVYMCRWRDFSSNVDPTSFFVENIL